MSFTKDNDSDNYATDENGWEMIKQYIPMDKKIWSPFYSDGKQKEIFKKMGFDIHHEDEDFFENDYGEVIIDNPPFSKFKLIVQRLVILNKPFILIAPSRTLNLKHFQNAFHKHLQIIIPFNRPTFTHLTHPKLGYTPPFGTHFFCWKMNLPKDLIFI